MLSFRRLFHGLIPGLFFFCGVSEARDVLQAVNLQTEHASNPLGIDAVRPRLSWQLNSTGVNVLQSAYRLVVASSAEDASAGRGDVWDSGPITSSDCVDVVYRGPAMQSARRYYWSVQVSDNQSHVSAWAPAVWWEMGLLAPNDWSGARWIAGAGSPSAPLLRATVKAVGKMTRARLYISAGGYDVVSVNGARVGNAVLDPGFTAYNKRILYSTYDVTDQLHSGANVLGVILGRGFYSIDTSRKILWWPGVAWLSPVPRLLAKLDITYTDHTHAILVSGMDWVTHSGPSTSDSLYRGETYDARLELPGWDTADYDAGTWVKAQTAAAPTSNVQAQVAEPIRVVNTVTAAGITQPKPGVYVYRFPVMLAGWARLTVSGAAGTTVTLRLGESLKGDGTVNNQGDPGLTPGEIQRYDYTLSGRGTEVWEPQFSYAGFQYVQLDHFPGTPTLQSIQAREVHSDVPVTGEFSCSDPLLNAIHKLCARAILNNLYSIPTDSPMFEKRGWCDSLLFAPQAIDNFGMQRFFAKWTDDLADSRDGRNIVAGVAPGCRGGFPDPSWGGAFLVVPWRLYERYGDSGVLSAHYDAMKRYVDALSAGAKNHLVTGIFGDWVSPGNVWPPEGPDLVAAANYYRDVSLLSKMAGVIGRPGDEVAYANLAAAIKESFNSKYLDASAGIYRTDKNAGYRQTSNAVPLDFGLVPANEVPAVVSHLADDVRLHGDHLNTGSFGTAALLPALSDNGHPDLAYAIASQATFPGWGYWVTQGATAACEQWMYARARSRDHAFLGSVDDWFFKYLAGIQPAAPGYRMIDIKPYVPAGLSSASASITTPRGVVASDWTRQADGTVDLKVVIPPNTVANVWVPGRLSPIQVGSGGYTYQGTTSGANEFRP